jgi:uncharacterized protein with PIN domain
LEAVPVAAIASSAHHGARSSAAMSAHANASAHLAAMSAAMSAQGGADGSSARFTHLGNFAALAQAFCAGSAQATEAARNLTPEQLANAAANAAAAMAHTWGQFPQPGFPAQPPHVPPRAAQAGQGDPSLPSHLHAPHFMGSLPFSSADAARAHHGASAHRDGAARAMSAALHGAHHGGAPPGAAEHASAALDAWRRFGKGRHPAGLNLGDCFAYALAIEYGCPLLFVGDDFARTDVAII